MKKLIFIIISAVMFFAACGNQTDNSVEESVQTQIDPSEEFGDIMFGMTQEEVINAIDEDADYVDNGNEGFIVYLHQTFFDVSDASIMYQFDSNGKFYSISVDYFDSKQVFDDYAVVKETVLKNYPPKTYNPRIYDYGEDDLLNYNTENRSIFLRLLDGNISLDIEVNEQILSDNDET